VARLETNMEQVVYFCHSHTTHGRFYQQMPGPDMVRCSCRWGLHNQRPQAKPCKQLTNLPHIVMEHISIFENCLSVAFVVIFRYSVIGRNTSHQKLLSLSPCPL
jgi:hypothetical protein